MNKSAKYAIIINKMFYAAVYIGLQKKIRLRIFKYKKTFFLIMLMIRDKIQTKHANDVYTQKHIHNAYLYTRTRIDTLITHNIC